MAVLRWDPWGELAALQRDVGQLLGRATGQDAARAPARGLIPPIDAFRSDEALVVRVELPGMDPSEVDVSVQEGVLTISGERRLDAGVRDDAWLRRERPVGPFERSFSLPEGTDAEKIGASFEHGVLELHIPHPPERKPHRIDVTSGAGTREAIDVGGRHGASS